MCGLLLSPASVSAQTLPGSADIDGTRLKPDVWTVKMTMQRGEQSMVMGTTRYELKAVDGADQWMLITTTTSQLGVATDTSVARRKGLEPLRHRSHAVPRKL